MSVAIEKVSIDPINQPSNGVYSNKSGSTVVQFEISQRPALLLGKTLRVQGKLRINQDTSTIAAPILVNNNNNKGAVAAYDSRTSARVGASSVFEQVSLQSAFDHQNIEVIRQYPRYLASTNPVIFSQSDIDREQQVGSLLASRDKCMSNLNNNDVSFSIPLRTGLLMGQDAIPLGNNGFRGLLVSLNLNSDQQVLNGTAGSFYSLHDVQLSFDVLVPDEKEQAEMEKKGSGEFIYNSISHLYSQLTSTDQTTNLNLGSSNVLGIQHSFIPVADQQSYTADSLRTSKLSGVKRVSFLKNGTLFPRSQPIDEEEIYNDGNIPVELVESFMSSIKPVYNTSHTMVSSQTEISKPLVVDSTSLPRFNSENPEAQPATGFGVRTDPLGIGTNFRNSQYGIRITADEQPSQMAMHTFVNARNVLKYSPDGIQVST